MAQLMILGYTFDIETVQEAGQMVVLITPQDPSTPQDIIDACVLGFGMVDGRVVRVVTEG